MPIEGAAVEHGERMVLGERFGPVIPPPLAEEERLGEEPARAEHRGARSRLRVPTARSASVASRWWCRVGVRVIAVAWWITASAPCPPSACRRPLPSMTSTTTACTPASRSRATASGVRVSASTLCPAWTRRGISALPRVPVAPVSRTLTTCPPPWRTPTVAEPDDQRGPAEHREGQQEPWIARVPVVGADMSRPDALRVSSLKERGRSTPNLVLDLSSCSSAASRPACGRAGVRRRGQGSGPKGRPRSGRRSLTSTPDGARCSGRRKRSRCGLVWLGVARWGFGVFRVEVHAPVPVCPGGWTGPVGGCRSSLRWRGMECCEEFAVGEVNQKGRPRRGRGS